MCIRDRLTRRQLLEKLWDIDERFVDEHTLTTSIRRIRSKIESDGGAPYILSLIHISFKLSMWAYFVLYPLLSVITT